MFYTAEQIVNWRTERVNGRETLTLLVLRENAPSKEPSGEVDEFEHATVEQLRVLKLVEGKTSQPRSHERSHG